MVVVVVVVVVAAVVEVESRSRSRSRSRRRSRAVAVGSSREYRVVTGARGLCGHHISKAFSLNSGLFCGILLLVPLIRFQTSRLSSFSDFRAFLCFRTFGL